MLLTPPLLWIFLFFQLSLHTVTGASVQRHGHPMHLRQWSILRGITLQSHTGSYWIKCCCLEGSRCPEEDGWSFFSSSSSLVPTSWGEWIVLGASVTCPPGTCSVVPTGRGTGWESDSCLPSPHFPARPSAGSSWLDLWWLRRFRQPNTRPRSLPFS